MSDNRRVDGVALFFWFAGLADLAMGMMHLVLGGFLGSTRLGSPLRDQRGFSLRGSLNPVLTVHFFLSAWIVLFYRRELLSSALGNALLGVIIAFWWVRAVDQWATYGWKSGLGNLLAVLFLVGGWLHLAPILSFWLR